MSLTPIKRVGSRSALFTSHPVGSILLQCTTVVFLERLQSYPALPSSHVSLLGTVYNFCTSTNAEIRFRFYEVALLDPSSPTAKAFARDAAAWVVGNDGTGILKGRMKFCRPIFRAVFKADKELAISTFLPAKSAFHPIASKLIEKV